MTFTFLQAAIKRFVLMTCLISVAVGAEQVAEIPYQSKWLKGHYNQRMEHFKLQPLNKGDIVFVGDSITEQGLNWAVRFDDLRIRNRGISGDMTYGVMARLDEMKATPPKAIFLKIGVNDIFNLYFIKEIQSLSSVSQNIEKITAELHQHLPDTQLFVQSILPDHRDFISVMARSVNQQIQSIKHKKFTYIDLHTAFVTPQGVLKPELTTDGTHLNEMGYQLWKQQLEPIMETLD